MSWIHVCKFCFEHELDQAQHYGTELAVREAAMVLCQRPVCMAPRARGVAHRSIELPDGHPWVRE